MYNNIIVNFWYQSICISEVTRSLRYNRLRVHRSAAYSCRLMNGVPLPPPPPPPPPPQQVIEVGFSHTIIIPITNAWNLLIRFAYTPRYYRRHTQSRAQILPAATAAATRRRRPRVSQI